MSAPAYRAVGTADGVGLRILIQATAELRERGAQLQELQQQAALTQRLLDQAVGAHNAAWAGLCEAHGLDPKTTRINVADNTPINGFPAGAILEPTAPE